MTYCKDYCEEKGISTSELNEAQQTLYYIAENMKMEKSISEDGYKYFQMAIKALEQESVLDKMREEIEQITDTMGVRYNQYISKIDVLQIIDKYKAENEIRCNYTDSKIAKSFIEDIEAVKDLLPRTESKDNELENPFNDCRFGG